MLFAYLIFQVFSKSRKNFYKLFNLGPEDPSFYNLSPLYRYFSNSAWSFFYRNYNEKAKFEDANRICREEGASLPIPTSGELIYYF